ncbi:NADP-dependent oxidoreductase [Actinoplanes sp. NPDC051851]|uniref:NADP-dependent oxidoreductase n=1 Tax=Actinoplanes sp. NPDC051851 TaxID=3154753 RepID=UPI00343BB5DA
MKAVRFHQYGASDVLIHEDVDTPTPGPGQVLIKVAATSFNPADAAIRAGYLQAFLPLGLPHIPGVDVAGTVAGLGPDVTGWAEGDAVVGFLPLTGQGAAAEYVLAPAAILAAAPMKADLVDAAALPGAGLTAWQAVFEHAGLTSGQSILINGAGGAVGTFAVQLAYRAGAEVTATAGPRSAARLKGHGAARLIDYTTAPVVQAAGRRYDAVLNLVPNAAEEAAALAGLVADGGVFVSATTPAPDNPGRGVRTVRMAVSSDAAQLAELVSRVDAGDLRIDVADRRPLADLAEVHRLADLGRLDGKTVITL